MVLFLAKMASNKATWVILSIALLVIGGILIYWGGYPFQFGLKGKIKGGVKKAFAPLGVGGGDDAEKEPWKWRGGFRQIVGAGMMVVGGGIGGLLLLTSMGKGSAGSGSGRYYEDHDYYYDEPAPLDYYYDNDGGGSGYQAAYTPPPHQQQQQYGGAYGQPY